MLVLIGVAFLSTAGWLISLFCRRSAARRHLVLSTALAGCLLLPIAIGVRAGTNWTMLTLPEWNEETQSISHDSRLPLETHSEEQLESLSDTVELVRSSLMIADASPQVGQGFLETATEAEIVQARERTNRVEFTAAAPKLWREAKDWGRAVYLFVAAVLLLRIFVSLAAVLRMKRKAVKLEAVRWRFPVFEADVAVPLAVGFGKPAIVLPHGFHTTIRSDELNDVLAHESEHLLRGDHWGNLLQSIAAALYWPIITVHLLNRALISAREELCDNAVLANRDPADYGHTLLAVAEKAAGSGRYTTQLAPSVVGVGELERRVAGLLDRQRDRRTRISTRVRWLVALSVLGLFLLTGTTRIVAVAQETPAKNIERANPKQVERPAPRDDLRWTDYPTVDLENPALHRGVVLAPDGTPLPGADVYAGSSIELLELAQGKDLKDVGVEDLGPVRAVTDEQGRFEFEAPDLTWVTPAGERKRWETLLVVTKEGVVPGWLKTWGQDRNLRSHWHPHPTRKVVVHTRKPASLSGQFLLEGGEPLVGAHIRITGFAAPIEYDLDKHIPKEEEDPLGLFQTIDYAERLYRPQLLPGLTLDAVTDQNGQFEFSGLPEGFIVDFEVTHPAAVTTNLRAAVREMEPVYRKPFMEQGKPQLSLYGSGFSTELPRGAELRGIVQSSEILDPEKAPGVLIARANQNAKEGFYGQRFRTDEYGEFNVTGLPKNPEGYDLAFVGSFDAPFADRRFRVVEGARAKVKLQPAVPYRLKLTDPEGNPVDRNVYSIQVQRYPRTTVDGVKNRFNDAERIAPGLYQGIIPTGPGAVLIKRGAKTDRPVAVDPKAHFAPGRTDWTYLEQRYAYGDQWRIAKTVTRGLTRNYLVEQLALAAVIFTDAQQQEGVLELSATVYTDPPVEVTLVDEDGNAVEGAKLTRQIKHYGAEDLPAKISLYGLHPERAEQMVFTHPQRGLIGTLTTTWKNEPLRVIMKPAATVIGRFVDKSGELNFDMGVRVTGEGVMPDTFIAGRMFHTTDLPGERRGEFRLVVPPGIEVRGDFVRKTGDRDVRPSAGKAFGPLIPQPGEVVDLGDLIVP